MREGAQRQAVRRGALYGPFFETGCVRLALCSTPYRADGDWPLLR